MLLSPMASANRDPYLLWQRSQQGICVRKLSASLHKVEPRVAYGDFERLSVQLCQQNKIFWPSVEVNDPEAFERRLALHEPPNALDNFVVLGLWGPSVEEKGWIVEALRQVLFPHSPSHYVWRDDLLEFEHWAKQDGKFGGIVWANLENFGETPREGDIMDHDLLGFLQDQEFNLKYAHMLILSTETPLQNWRPSALKFRYKVPWVEVDGPCAFQLRRRE